MADASHLLPLRPLSTLKIKSGGPLKGNQACTSHASWRKMAEDQKSIDDVAKTMLQKRMSILGQTCRAANVKRWDGMQRRTTDWDNLRRVSSPTFSSVTESWHRVEVMKMGRHSRTNGYRCFRTPSCGFPRGIVWSICMGEGNPVVGPLSAFLARCCKRAAARYVPPPSDLPSTAHFSFLFG